MRDFSKNELHFKRAVQLENRNVGRFSCGSIALRPQTMDRGATFGLEADESRTTPCRTADRSVFLLIYLSFFFIFF